MKILIADDNEFKIRDICEYLNDLGENDIDIVNYGIDAYNKVKDALDNKESYDLVFLDMQFPLRHGDSILRDCGEITAFNINSLKEKYTIDKPYIVICSSEHCLRIDGVHDYIKYDSSLYLMETFKKVVEDIRALI